MNGAAMADLVEGCDPDSDGFWTALADREIQLRKCTRCSTHYALPLPTCPECGGDPELVTAAGTGELYTWVVVRHAFGDHLAAEVPYVVGAVQLDEGARLMARIENVPLPDLVPGMPLVATFPEGPERPPIVFVPRSAS